MTESRQKWIARIRWFAAEFLIVVVGILVAFSINSAWDTRGERIREEAALVSLKNEFQASKQDLDQKLRVHNRRIASVRILAGIGTKAFAVPSSDSLEAMIDILAGWMTYDPLLSTLGALEGSGDLSILRNEQLKMLIARYQSELGDLRETEAIHKRSVTEDVYEWFRQGPPMGTNQGNLPDHFARPTVENTVPHLGSHRFQNLAAQESRNEFYVIAELERVGGTLDEILNLLEFLIDD